MTVRAQMSTLFVQCACLQDETSLLAIRHSAVSNSSTAGPTHHQCNGCVQPAAPCRV